MCLLGISCFIVLPFDAVTDCQVLLCNVCNLKQLYSIAYHIVQASKERKRTESMKGIICMTSSFFLLWVFGTVHIADGLHGLWRSLCVSFEHICIHWHLTFRNPLSNERQCVKLPGAFHIVYMQPNLWTVAQ